MNTIKYNVYYATGKVEKGRSLPPHTELYACVVENAQNGYKLFFTVDGERYTASEFIPSHKLSMTDIYLAESHRFRVKISTIGEKEKQSFIEKRPILILFIALGIVGAVYFSFIAWIFSKVCNQLTRPMLMLIVFLVGAMLDNVRPEPPTRLPVLSADSKPPEQAPSEYG